MYSIYGSKDDFKSKYSGFIGLAPFTENTLTYNFKKRDHNNNFMEQLKNREYIDH